MKPTRGGRDRATAIRPRGQRRPLRDLDIEVRIDDLAQSR